MPISHAWEKLMTAVMGMARSPLPIQQRVRDAVVYNVMLIRPENLPPDMEYQSPFEEIMQRCTSQEPEGDEGQIEASTSRMSDEEAAEVAGLIVDLYDNVAARYHDVIEGREE